MGVFYAAAVWLLAVSLLKDRLRNYLRIRVVSWGSGCGQEMRKHFVSRVTHQEFAWGMDLTKSI